MTSVDSSLNFLCGRPHGGLTPPLVHMRPLQPDIRVDVINVWPLRPICNTHFLNQPIEARGQPHGSFLSTSFDQQSVLSLIGETSCLQWRNHTRAITGSARVEFIFARAAPVLKLRRVSCA